MKVKVDKSYLSFVAVTYLILENYDGTNYNNDTDISLSK